jgi:hypothetical protein
MIQSLPNRLQFPYFEKETRTQNYYITVPFTSLKRVLRPVSPPRVDEIPPSTSMALLTKSEVGKSEREKKLRKNRSDFSEIFTTT